MNNEYYSRDVQSEIHSALFTIVAEKQLRVTFSSLAFSTKFNWDPQTVNNCLYITKHVFFCGLL